MKPKYPEGFLEANLSNCRKRMTCEGGCTNHTGDVRAVRVIDCRGVPHDWGYYNYCDEAVAEDIWRGMTVIHENEDGFANDPSEPRGK